MKSKWGHLKDEAIRLRKRGRSLPWIEDKLGMPRSTLHYWIRDVKLSTKQKENIKKHWKEGLGTARAKAVLWHNARKAERMVTARLEAMKVLDETNVYDVRMLEIALSILYMGEGSKKNCQTALGSSDPLILKFFLAALRKLYPLEQEVLRCDLYLRADQDVEAIKRYWAKELDIPLHHFKFISKDKRTMGSNTFKDYKGVCAITYGGVAIQRKLVYLSRAFCERYVQSQRP